MSTQPPAAELRRVDTAYWHAMRDRVQWIRGKPSHRDLATFCHDAGPEVTAQLIAMIRDTAP